MKWPGAATAIWYFFQYAYSPVFVFAAADSRLTDRRYSASVLSIVIQGIYGPWLATVLPLSQQTQTWMWTLCPLFVTAGQYLVAILGIIPNTLTWDRLHNPTGDLRKIRKTMGVLVSFSAVAWWQHFPFFFDHLNPRLTLIDTGPLLFFYTASLIWIVYAFFDLKQDGLIRCSWVRFSMLLALTTATLGVGATTGLMWVCRENILAWRRSKGARGYEHGGGLKLKQ